MSKTKASGLLISCGTAVRAFTLDGTEVPVPPNSVYNNSNPTTTRWYPNGRLLAVGTSTGVIAFHHHEKLDVIGNFNASSGAQSPSAIQCIDVTSGSRFLAAGTDSGELNIWDMKSSNIVNRFSVSGPVQSVSFQHTSESRYVACSSGSDVFVFSRASGRLVDSFTVANDKSSNLPSTEDESSNSSLRRSPSSSREKVTGLAFSSHSANLLAVTDTCGCVNVWDVARTHAARTGATPQRTTKSGTDATYSRFTSPLRTPATDLAFASSTSPVGLFVAGLDKHIRIYDRSLRRFLFSIICAAPVASIAHCWNDSYIAAGCTNGEIVILKLDLSNQSADVSVTLPPTLNRLADVSLNQSRSVSCLHFQPPVSGITDATAARTPKLPRAMQGSGHEDEEDERALYERQSHSNHGAQRSNTTPAPGILSGMLVETPQRPADDSLLRRARGRDSDIFSPLVRAPHSKRNFSLETPNDSSLAKNLSGEYVGGDVLEPIDRPKIPSSVGRRDSDIIPSMAPAGQHYTSFQDTSLVDNSLLDADAVDSLLGSSPGESFGTSAHRTDAPSPIRLDESRHDGIGRYTSAIESDTGTEREKVTTLPRGQAFRRLRKSVSEVSPRRQLPPRQPRSSTVTNMRGAVDEEAPREIEHPFVPQSQESGTSFSRAIGAHAVDDGSRAGHSSSEHVKEASPIPPLQRKSGLPNGHDKQLSEICKTVKQTIVAELDAIREDLRSDILNIHTELVLSSSRQLREVEQLFTDRDRVIAELRQEVAELRQANTRLQEMYIDD